MHRRTFIFATLSAVTMAGMAAAASLQDSIIAQLQAQGFTSIKVSKTFLGRVRIVATSAKYRREIILNPRTGEILRDYWIVLDETAAADGVQIAAPDDDREDRGDSSGAGDLTDPDEEDDSESGGGTEDTEDDDEPEEHDEPEDSEGHESEDKEDDD